ncbi:MAG: hypothetical protein H6996_08250 [Moraxellaceae bacterium]|nr:hypothetical protein [Moraxellaceae bacterium]MCP5176106.1 hypothetical protein [Moraxellaceae bacterium]
MANISHHFQQQAQKQVNVALTLRNWLIGAYLVEYEQQGEDRAQYGEKLYKNLAKKLQEQGLKGLSFKNLHLCKQFYMTYPQIVQTVSEQLPMMLQSGINVLQSTSISTQSPPTQWQINVFDLINSLSFSHIIELLKADLPLKRFFMKLLTIKRKTINGYPNSLTHTHLAWCTYRASTQRRGVKSSFSSRITRT